MVRRRHDLSRKLPTGEDLPRSSDTASILEYVSIQLFAIPHMLDCYMTNRKLDFAGDIEVLVDKADGVQFQLR